jgi:hypothetical protein
MNHKLYLCILFLLSIILVNADNIITTDGTLYKNVSIEGVNPSGIDIGYNDPNGNFILKGLKFTELSSDEQRRFGYKPQAAMDFEQKISQYSSGDMDDVALAQKQKVENIIKEVKAKLSGVQVNIKPDDLRYAIFALRRAVRVKPTATIRQGCVVTIETITSGKPIPGNQVILDGVSLPSEGSWTGFIYPTGVKANSNGSAGLPVFTENPNRALEIISKYLNIYGEYASNVEQQNPATQQDIAAPDQVLDNSDNYYSNSNNAASNTNQSVADTSNEQPMQDNTSQSSQEYSYYPQYDGLGCSYYLGGSYAPVNWYWHHHNYPHPHPRPHPTPHPLKGQQGGNYYHHGSTGGFHPSSGGMHSGGGRR